MHQKLARTPISRQELLRKMWIFSEIFFILAFIIQFISLNFHQTFKPANITRLPKRVTENLRKILDQPAYFQTSQKSLNNTCFVKIPVSRIPV